MLCVIVNGCNLDPCSCRRHNSQRNSHSQHAARSTVQVAPVRTLRRGLRPSASATSTCTSPPPPRASSSALRSGRATMRMGQSSSSSAASSSLSSPPLHRSATTLHAGDESGHMSVLQLGLGGVGSGTHTMSVGCHRRDLLAIDGMHADNLVPARDVPVFDAAALLATSTSDEHQLRRQPCNSIQGGTIFLRWRWLLAHDQQMISRLYAHVMKSRRSCSLP